MIFKNIQTIFRIIIAGMLALFLRNVIGIVCLECGFPISWAMDILILILAFILAWVMLMVSTWSGRKRK